MEEDTKSIIIYFNLFDVQTKLNKNLLDKMYLDKYFYIFKLNLEILSNLHHYWHHKSTSINWWEIVTENKTKLPIKKEFIIIAKQVSHKADRLASSYVHTAPNNVRSRDHFHWNVYVNVLVCTFWDSGSKFLHSRVAEQVSMTDFGLYVQNMQWKWINVKLYGWCPF